MTMYTEICFGLISIPTAEYIWLLKWVLIPLAATWDYFIMYILIINVCLKPGLWSYHNGSKYDEESP